MLNRELLKQKRRNHTEKEEEYWHVRQGLHSQIKLSKNLAKALTALVNETKDSRPEDCARIVGGGRNSQQLHGCCLVDVDTPLCNHTVRSTNHFTRDSIDADSFLMSRKFSSSMHNE